MKGNLGDLGRLRKPTRDVGAPRISHCKKLLLPLGLKRLDGVRGRGVMEIELLQPVRTGAIKGGAACWEL